MPPINRGYVSGSYLFVLNGVPCGFIKSLEGGSITAEVINEAAGPTYYTKKHIGQPKYEDVTVQIGFSMHPSVYQWIAASWNMSYQRRDISIVEVDNKLNIQSERQFFNALITETTIPACDGSSKEPAYLTLKLAPEYTRTNKAPMKLTTSISNTFSDKNKLWLPSNFRLEIDGLDCSKVSKIDAFTIKQTAVTDDIGEARDYLKEPGKLEFPNLKITLPESSAQSWTDWHEDFVIRGNNDESQEKNGSLTFLSPNRQDELATIKLHNLGIFKLTPEKTANTTDQIKRITAELYCEQMELIIAKIK